MDSLLMICLTVYQSSHSVTLMLILHGYAYSSFCNIQQCNIYIFIEKFVFPQLTFSAFAWGLIYDFLCWYFIISQLLLCIWSILRRKLLLLCKSDIFETIFSKHSLHEGVLLKHPSGKMKKSFGDRSFSVAAPTLWNAFPVSLRSIKCISTFKSDLKTCLSKLAFNIS